MRLVCCPYDRQTTVWSSGCLRSLTRRPRDVFVSGKLPSPETGIDDANIFVYARNVSAGNGFVFNQGGERVEGFTSLLWVLIASLATALNADPEGPLLILNVLLVSATVVELPAEALRGLGRSPFSFCCCLICLMWCGTLPR